MKNWFKKFAAAALLVFAAQSVAFAQNGFVVNDRDGAVPQILYRVNINTGAATNVGNLVDNVSGANIVTEYEGLASIGSALYGVSEYDPSLVNPLDRANCALIGPNGRTRIIGQTGTGAENVLIGTEAGAAYNAADGFIYAAYGDDLGAFFSRLYRVSPNTCAAVEVGNIAAGGSNLIVDGLAFDNAGNLFASDGRITDSLYTLDINSGAATLNCTLPATNEDSALAFDFANSRLFVLYEGALPAAPSPRLQQITPTGSGACGLGTSRNLIGSGVVPGDYEGFDIPTATVR